MKDRWLQAYLVVVAAGATVAIGVGLYALFMGYRDLGLLTLVSGLLGLVLGAIGYLSLRDIRARRDYWRKRKGGS